MSSCGDTLAGRAERWLGPVPGSAPGGVSARLEPSYQELAQEVVKLDAPTGGEVDWKKVAAGADELLRTRSKDLNVAAYLARALLATEGIGGLGVGLLAFAGILDRYWDTAFPEVKRLRGRVNSAQWLVERSATTLADADPRGTELDTLRAVEEAARRFSEVLRARFADAAPAVGPLVDALQRLTITAEQAQPAPPPPEAQAAPPPAAEPAPVSPPTGPALPAPPAEGFTSLDGGIDYLRSVGEGLVTAGAALRRAVPADPLGYRILRTGLWLHLGRPPPAPGGKLGVPPPADGLRDALGLMVQHQRWTALLEEAESALQQHRYWLDPHRLSVQALEGLGPSHAAAADAIRAELRAFLARMPGLLTFSFAGGAAVADAQTRAWIDEAVSPPQGGASSPAVDDALPEDEVAAARALLASGRVREGLVALNALVSAQPSGRARFRARLALGRAAAASGLHALARGTFQALDHEAEQHQLDAWEPALAVECLRGLVSSARALAQESRADVDLTRQYQRLCRLDPAAAYDVQP
jgi:type VI secretion system protein VasJ